MNKQDMSGYILKKLTYGTKLLYIREKYDAAIWIASLLENVARTPLLKADIEVKLSPPGAVDGILADLSQTTVCVRISMIAAKVFALAARYTSDSIFRALL